MVEGCLGHLSRVISAKIIFPNKKVEPPYKFHEGHLLELETYVGGHVESLHSGIFRADIPIHFRLDTQLLEQLRRDVDEIIRFAVVEEGKLGVDIDQITNFEEIKTDIGSCSVCLCRGFLSCCP
mgnify:CR=1 FL=1